CAGVYLPLTPIGNSKTPAVTEDAKALVTPTSEMFPPVIMYRAAEYPAIDERLVEERFSPYAPMLRDPLTNVSVPVTSWFAPKVAPEALLRVRFPNFPFPLPVIICVELPASVILPVPELVCTAELETFPITVIVLVDPASVPLLSVSIPFTRILEFGCTFTAPPAKVLLTMRLAKFVRLPAVPVKT